MKKTIKKIIKSYIKTVGKLKFSFILFFGIFVAVISVLEPMIFAKIIDQIEEFLKTGIFNLETTIYIIIFWGIYILFTLFMQYTYDYFLVGRSNNKHFVNQTNYYADKIISMNYSEYLMKEQGKLYKIFDRGTESQFRFMYFLLIESLKHVSGILVIIGLLFFIDVRMAFLTLSMVPVMIALGLFFMIKVGPYQQKLNTKWDSVFGSIGNILSAFSLTKTLGLEKKYKKDLNNRLSNILTKQIAIDKYWSISSIYSGMTVMIARIIVLGFGVFFVINGSLSFSDLFLFFAYIGWIYFPLGFLFTRLRDVSIQIIAVEKMYKEFDNTTLDDIDSGKEIKNLKGIIEYENVGFGYSKNIRTFKKLNFKINSGEKIAFVGNTGAGKSTIVNLLFRFWDVDSGKILIDGNNIKDISKKSLRKNIGIVAQDNSLFNASIKQNLLYANPKATKEDLEKALNNAEASFVFDLEKGINTIIGERGLKLSGGEKQRLSIARLFLKNPKILVLDEATSALDNKTEKLIQKSLNKLTKNRTSIVIAHRLSTIQNADKIFMLENGKIVESGTYKELMNKKAKFYNLANPEHLILN